MGMSTIEAEIPLIKLPDSSEIFASDGTVNRFDIDVEIDLAKYLDDFLQPIHFCSICDNYLGKDFKNESQIMFEGLISCPGGKRFEHKNKIVGMSSIYNQILVDNQYFNNTLIFLPHIII